MEIFKIENLTFKYPASEKCALSNVSLSIKRGEFITVCGPSGCGKTTLLRLLKPVLAPKGERNGTVLFDGQLLHETDLRTVTEKIGFVMQSPDSQIVTDKVWHELAFGLESLSVKNNEIRARVSEMASFFGIEEWYHKKTTELSGGQKQLLNLASVMVMNPSVLILDEPTSQLDPIASREFLEAVSKINRELGVTVIMSEHRLEEATAFTDRIIVMEDGAVVSDTTPGRTAAVLKEKKSIMLSAMSTAMRVFAQLGEGENTPVAVREGREELAEIVRNNPIRTVAAPPKEVKNKTAIELNEIYFRYEKDAPDVLKNLSLSVAEGEFYALLGGNGSGKSTLLSILCGVNKPLRGKAVFSNKDAVIGYLPQNPQTLFVEKTVEKELREMLPDEKLFNETVFLCMLGDLLDRHPYDLSGGEAQRLALAKVLLRNPDILLLDEPTKGMDAHFKKQFARIIKELQKKSVTIIMVSHDIEFCCEYSDRCGMLFDGSVVSEDEPRAFFSGKNFYTTAANRMARGIIPDAVTADDIIYACGGERENDEITPIENSVIREEKPTAPKAEKTSCRKIVSGIILLLIGLFEIVLLNGRFEGWRTYAVDLLIIITFTASFSSLVRGKYIEYTEKLPTKRHIVKELVLSVIFIFLLMPLTVLGGIYIFDDRKYYFICLLLIIEAIVFFAISFEQRKPSVREIVIISVLCAIGVSGRIVFAPIAQFKPLGAIIIIAGVAYGAQTGFLVGAVSAFLSNFFFSQGPWTPWQMFAFGMLGFFAGLLFHTGILKKTRIFLCVYGLLATVFIYGPLADLSVLSYVRVPTLSYLITYFAGSLPFNLIHGVSTVFFLYIFSQAMLEKLWRMNTKFGL